VHRVVAPPQAAQAAQPCPSKTPDSNRRRPPKSAAGVTSPGRLWLHYPSWLPNHQTTTSRAKTSAYCDEPAGLQTSNPMLDVEGREGEAAVGDDFRALVRRRMPFWATKFTNKTSVTILGATTPRLIDLAGRAARPLGTLDEIVMRAQGGPAESLIRTSHWPACIVLSRSASRKQSTRHACVSGRPAVRKYRKYGFGASAVPRSGRMHLYLGTIGMPQIWVNPQTAKEGRRVAGDQSPHTRRYALSRKWRSERNDMLSLFMAFDSQLTPAGELQGPMEPAWQRVAAAGFIV
jgi:hypothetical protein